MNAGEHICWSSVPNFDYFAKDMSKSAWNLQSSPTQDDGWSFLDCMEHCNKLGTRYPTLGNSKELVSFADDILMSFFGNYLWLSVTDGVESMHMKRPNYWAKNITATPGVWRDFYTGDEVDFESGETDVNNRHCVQTDGKVNFTSDCSVQPDRIVPFCLCQNSRQNPKHSLLLRGLCPLGCSVLPQSWNFNFPF